MIAEASPGAKLRSVRPLSGGLAAATFAVDTTAGDVIVKVYPPGHEGAVREWDGLNFAQRTAGIAVPEPVALDANGRWFGSPTVVMSRLPGRADVAPTDLDSWLKQIAQSLAAIHETDTVGAAGSLLSPAWGDRALETSEAARRSDLVERCIEAIRQHPPRPPRTPVLMHGDFHPGNIMWAQGTLTGVLDWGGARLGSRWFDLAYCRADVALLFGIRGVRRLTELYLDTVGSLPVDLPAFDLMCGLAAHRLGASKWLHAYRHQGCTDTPRQFTARVTPFLHQALAELGV